MSAEGYFNVNLILLLLFFMIKQLRFLLLPFSALYGLAISVRHYLYDQKLLLSKKFDIPLIVIGNLAVGGTGKSPMTEYLIRLLKDSFKVATLSRGYGRKTTGFMYVEEEDSAEMAGDEPLQFKCKYPDITVAVSTDRVLGVNKLKDWHDVILLDDALQHRALVPGLSILLLEYSSLFQSRLLLPAGDFRDTYNRRKCADIIVISKSPTDLSEENRQKALMEVAAEAHQPVFFSYLKYGKPYRYIKAGHTIFKEEKDLEKGDAILVVSGIANPAPLYDYVTPKVETVQKLSYRDHHLYSEKDISVIRERFDSIQATNKYILTTEKDFQRLKGYIDSSALANLPIYVVPIEASFSREEADRFCSLILDYCKKGNNVETN